MSMAFDDSGAIGPVVVCLPMFRMTRAATAAAFRPAFAGTGLREVYLDLPGHGDSPAQCPTESQAVLDTVCAWLDDHLDAPVLLAGGSYGAYLAAGVARQRPDLVRGLLLVCPGIRMARDSRDLPERTPLDAPACWLDAAPAVLHDHLDLALGHRSAATVQAVLAALQVGGPGDERFLNQLQGGPHFALPDEDAEIMFSGPVSVMMAGGGGPAAGDPEDEETRRRRGRSRHRVNDVSHAPVQIGDDLDVLPGQGVSYRTSRCVQSGHSTPVMAAPPIYSPRYSSASTTY